MAIDQRIVVRGPYLLAGPRPVQGPGGRPSQTVRAPTVSVPVNILAASVTVPHAVVVDLEGSTSEAVHDVPRYVGRIIDGLVLAPSGQYLDEFRGDRLGFKTAHAYKSRGAHSPRSERSGTSNAARTRTARTLPTGWEDFPWAVEGGRLARSGPVVAGHEPPRRGAAPVRLRATPTKQAV